MQVARRVPAPRQNTKSRLSNAKNSHTQTPSLARLDGEQTLRPFLPDLRQVAEQVSDPILVVQVGAANSCHPERSEGSAFHKRRQKKQIPRPVQKANGARNDICRDFSTPCDGLDSQQVRLRSHGHLVAHSIRISSYAFCSAGTPRTCSDCNS